MCQAHIRSLCQGTAVGNFEMPVDHHPRLPYRLRTLGAKRPYDNTGHGLQRISLRNGTNNEERFMTRKRVRLAMLGIGLAGAMMMRPGDVRVSAQESNRGEDAVVKLAGRKVRIDKNSGKLRDLSEQEARELVSTLTAMTTRTESSTATPRGGTLVQMNGFDHVLVARPNDNGTNDVECVTSVEEAVAFLSQLPKSGGKE
jgi:hypothetical protein